MKDKDNPQKKASNLLPMTQPVNVRLPVVTLDRLRSEARSSGETVSDIIRERVCYPSELPS